jgi:glucokinase
VEKEALPEEQTAERFLDILMHLASQVGMETRSAAGAGFAMPGPFDYAEGVSWMRHKMPYLYGISLREGFARRMGWSGAQVRFLNDAAAFLLGEVGAGAARGIGRAVGITLGTGIGSGFAVNGVLVTTGAGVPPGGEIWNVPFEGGIVEDLISTRSIKRRYLERTGQEHEVAEIAAGAVEDPHAKGVFTAFGRDLGRVLRTLLHDFAPDAVVLGGGIARSADLFLPAAQKELEGLPLQVRISALGDRAPLVGAGVAWLAGANAQAQQA